MVPHPRTPTVSIAISRFLLKGFAREYSQRRTCPSNRAPDRQPDCHDGTIGAMRPPEVAPEGDPSTAPKGTRIRAATRAVRMPELLLGMGPKRVRRSIGGLVFALGG